ncbi:hypothetical protein FQN50_008852 [Emmonsiellopsis sp. PD_5]|nr:hypothetical protein FQN50_008852 [Emmonsiellopsis sp. PD_5]
MSDEELQEWKTHFGIENDAFIVLKYIMSTEMGEESPTRTKDPFQALKPWLQRFSPPKDAVIVLEYLLSNQRSNAVLSRGTHDQNTPPSYSTETDPPARDSYSLDTSQLSDSANDVHISTTAAVGVPDIQTFDQTAMDQAAFYAVTALQTLGQDSGYISPAAFHPSPNGHCNFGGPPTLDPSPNATMTLVPDISEGFGERVHEAVSQETVKGKSCIKCWLEKRKCDGDVGLCSRCVFAGVSLPQRICVRVCFADKAIFSKWKEPSYMMKLCWRSLKWLAVEKEVLLKHEEYGPTEPLIQYSLRLWAATRLLMKGWHIHGDEKLEMTEVRQPSSPLYGTVPVPRVLQNQLDQTLEEYIVLCEGLFLRDLQNLIKRRDRGKWVVVVLALTIMLNVLERDIWRLLYWIRHPAEANAWRHPSRPCTLVDKNIYLSNLMLSHFRSAVGGPSPLALDWSDSYITMLVGGDERTIEAMKQLSVRITHFEVHSFLGKKGCHQYKEASEDSLDFTLSSLPFMESAECFARLQDFVGDGQFGT